MTPRTRAVVVYHVAGYPTRLEEIAALCKDRGIALIEDCNAALGASVDGGPVGQVGDFAVYSFYPNRQLNAIEGGALVCNDSATAQSARRLRRFGIDAARFRDRLGEIDPACDVPEIGWSASLNQLSAALALEQLDSLPVRQRQTREVARALSGASATWRGANPVAAAPGLVPAYWAFLLLVGRRDHAIEVLKAQGIQASRLHYRNDTYSGFGAQRRPLPGTDDFMSRVLAVPCGWWLDQVQMARLLNALGEVLGPAA